MPGRRFRDHSLLSKLGEPSHREYDVEVSLTKPPIDVQVIQPNVLLRAAERNHAEAGIAPPRVAPLVLLIKRSIVLARDSRGCDQRYRAFAERLRKWSERNHAWFLSSGPGLHDLPRGKVEKPVRV